MPEWILAMTVGPVGHFIAGGRRSRDLWWGSTWVSECSVEVAKELQKEAGNGGRLKLLIPSWDRIGQVLTDYRPKQIAYGGRISNRLLVRVAADGWTGKDVEALAGRCEDAARQHLRRQVESAYEHLKVKTYRRGNEHRSLYQDLEEIWIPEDFGRQVDALASREDADFLEFYAAWTPIEGDDLQASIERVQDLLDGRKRARLFRSPAWTRPGRPKSDLDGGRDSVLSNVREVQLSKGEASAESHRFARRRLGIGLDEDLDALGLARRLAVFQPGPNLKRLPFPPLSRTAIDPWLERVAGDPETQETLKNIRKILDRELRGARTEKNWERLFFTWCSPARDPWQPLDKGPRGGKPPVEKGKLFPFDASFLLDGGLDALWMEVDRLAKPTPKDPWARSIIKHTQDLLDLELRPPVRRLHSIHGPPPPYFALLAMDGDGVGNALTVDHRDKALDDRVRALNAFGDEAEAIIRSHHGCPFYIGGDDIMAYLPIDKSLLAARELAARFRETSKEAFCGDAAVSLSGGLIFAHVKSDLRFVRRQAERALKNAKEQRRQAMERAPADSGSRPRWLEIRELPRSGPARACNGRLEELIDSVIGWQELLEQQRLSPRSAQLLMELRYRLGPPKGAPKSPEKNSPGVELAAYRILSQTGRSGMQATALQERLRELATWDQVEQLAAELQVAVRYQRVAALRPSNEVSS